MITTTFSPLAMSRTLLVAVLAALLVSTASRVLAQRAPAHRDAVVTALREVRAALPEGQVVLEPVLLRHAGPPFGYSNDGIEQLDSVSANEISGALNARVATRGQAVACEPETYRCRFVNAKVLMATTDAQVIGDTAHVVVRVEIDHRPGVVKGQEVRVYDVWLLRRRNGWMVRAVVLNGRS